LINGPFLFKDKGSSAQYGAGMALAIERGWLTMHESGLTCVPAGADLFA
jgi:stage V sporulation protein SpoVS